jgi:hypothetical protein
MSASFDSAPRFCGETERPGRVESAPDWRDWSERETSPDQLRIEDWLWDQPLAGAALLHLGCGNSRLAGRFAGRAARIDGVTLCAAEQSRGESLRLARYRVLLLNKYTPALAALPGGYRYVVDNNPSAYACCRTHVEQLLRSCASLLEPGGLFVTDAVGLQWVPPGGVAELSMSFDSLARVGAACGLEARRETDSVYSLRKP